MAVLKKKINSFQLDNSGDINKIKKLIIKNSKF